MPFDSQNKTVVYVAMFSSLLCLFTLANEILKKVICAYLIFPPDRDEIIMCYPDIDILIDEMYKSKIWSS